MNNPTNTNAQIWLIDDDQSIRWVLQKTLQNNGYQVTVFESGSVALAAFKRAPVEQRPNVILTDVRMPGISGFELLKQVKNIAADIPIIIMTAYSDLDATVHNFEEGAFEYLAKPFDIDDAIAMVNNACDQSASPIIPTPIESTDVDWESPLRRWAEQKLANGDTDILKQASQVFEQALLESALEATGGRKQEAAKLLGWGRNTLTRKLKAFR